MRISVLVFLMTILFGPIIHAQNTTFPVQGIPDPRTGWYAFTHATIHIDHQQVLEQATLVIREGRITDLGQQVTPPAGAVVIDLQGRSIYPAFIDLASEYGLNADQPDQASRGARRNGDQWISNRPGAYAWNDALKTDFHAALAFQPDPKAAESYRKAGFAAVLTHRHDGISRGTSALVSLADLPPGQALIREQAGHHLSFKKGSSPMPYPGSLMGCIALLRQTYLDGDWLKRTGTQKEHNLSLEAWNAVQDLPQFFETRDWQEVLRAQQIANEFGKTYIYRSGGDEYRRINELKQTGATFILPLTFPEAFDIQGPFDALQVSLEDLMHWEWAPANAGALARAGIPFALTMEGLKKPEDFFPAVRQAIANGLDAGLALEALTAIPARLVGLGQDLGTLAVGKRASFLITSGPVFDAETTLFETWIDGKPYVIQAADEPDLDGKYSLTVGSAFYALHVTGGISKNEYALHLDDTTQVDVKGKWDRGRIDLQFQMPNQEGLYLLSGYQQDKVWNGRGTDALGEWFSWRAVFQDTIQGKTPDKQEPKAFDPASLTPIRYPFMAYGWTQKPRPRTYLIKDATVWTNTDKGILEHTDILIENGQVKKVGKDLRHPDALIREVNGRHVTPGMIDEHSHIAISRGVNECTQENTAEVRIGDVVNSEDINIYRQLASGVTTSQLLHGSCNPVGGQSTIIKLRWGSIPEDMKLKGAPGFIKFALGENVKRSNGGENNTRYPNTRMGVEQVYVNAFQRAREYEQQLKDPAARATTRRDLELETMLEILNKKRFITCHSYVQSEINMLMHVAEDFGFRVNTFTHILEGYKVADKMARHGVGGSSFSDWWAYKFEVYDAIPYNGALMHQEGVVTAFNSDDAEMARRLNQEAAKAVRYGGVSEEEALKFVTLNPARLLHIDDRVGSIQPGMDADLVIWSDHPLSVYAHAQVTFLDGIIMVDEELDRQAREEIQQVRQGLIRKMKADGGKNKRPPGRKTPHLYHCDSDFDEISQ
ncbi:MAG: amidohydrolase family protein [Saprospiraceae bacterium]